jgi:hypothetical protein
LEEQENLWEYYFAIIGTVVIGAIRRGFAAFSNVWSTFRL